MAMLGQLHRPVANAACAYCRHVRRCRHCGSPRPDLASFVHAEPSAAQALVAYYDSWYPGFNGVVHRSLATPETKIRHALAESRHQLGCTPRRGIWLRRHAGMVALTAFLLLLPMLLSPTHPIAVYAYLAEYYLPIVGSATTPVSDEELRTFLLSDPQLQRYKMDLQEDIRAINTGMLFAIVRRHDGALEQRAVRTWNEFLPAHLPKFIIKRLDRKEISFLGDVVDAYLQSARIEAMGHYHSYGGPPSRGDRLALHITRLPEIVVSNGIYPMVYVKGRILDFGSVSADEDIQSLMTRLDISLQSGAEPAEAISCKATDTTKSFISYLHERRNVNIDSLDEIRGEIIELCADFKSKNKGLYTKGVTAYEREDPDIYQFLNSVEVLTDWATYGLLRKGWTVAGFAASDYAAGKRSSLR